MRQNVDVRKYKATKVHYIMEERYLKGNLLRKPVWFDPVMSLPPLPAPTAVPQHDMTRFISHQFDPKSGQPFTGLSHEEAAEYCRGLKTNKWFKYSLKGGRVFNRKVREAQKVMALPPNLVFPEDSIRQRFQREHPFEAMRPIKLQDQKDNKNEPVLDVHDVTAMAMDLMEKQKMSENEAYKTACKRYYNDRTKMLTKELTDKAQELARLFKATTLKEGVSEMADGSTQDKPELQVNKRAEEQQTSSDLWLKLEEKSMLEGALKRSKSGRSSFRY